VTVPFTEWIPTSDHAPDAPAGPARDQYAEAHSLDEVNRLAERGWQVLTVAILPTGARYYLLQRATGSAPTPGGG
jgi:hypothetical protein